MLCSGYPMKEHKTHKKRIHAGMSCRAKGTRHEKLFSPVQVWPYAALKSNDPSFVVELPLKPAGSQ